MENQTAVLGDGRRYPTELSPLMTRMADDQSNENATRSKPQFSIRTLFKLTTWAAVLIYIVWSSRDHLGFTLIVFVTLSPFIFFAEIVDWLLGAKRS